MKQFFYLPFWFWRAKLFGVKRPLQSVIFITDRCNLACKHCAVYNHKNPVSKSFEQIEEELKYCYGLGSRIVDFEGGEPFLWRDGDKDINDLVCLAKKIGFYSSTITTNAQLPFDGNSADSMWVSLDGLGEFHDQIRGRGAFEKLEKNIASCGHPALSANMVINSKNYSCVEQTIKWVAQNPALQAISLNFHSPYPGTEDLFLPWQKRAEVIELIISLKKQGYPILNSASGLRLMKQNKFKRACWVTNFIMADGTRFAECAAKSEEMCAVCGLCMAGEMRALFQLKFDTLFGAIKLRLKSSKLKK